MLFKKQFHGLIDLAAASHKTIWGHCTAFFLSERFQGVPLAQEDEGSSSGINSKWDKLNPETPAAEHRNCLGDGWVTQALTKENPKKG